MLIRSVIKYIIEGIQDDPVNKTILHGAKTIRELKQKFTQYYQERREIKGKAGEARRKEEDEPRRHECGRKETVFQLR